MAVNRIALLRSMRLPVDYRTSVLKAPFPYFGGKSRVASVVWSRFGDVRNYVEPFCGSLAVLLARPTPPRTETVNDADAYLSNFWRAIQLDPDAVAKWADWPVNEIDLAARRDWVFAQTEFRDRMWRDPEYYDAKIAGWWVWGMCGTIGSSWKAKSTHLGAGMGIHRPGTHLGDAGMGTRLECLTEYFRALSARLERVRVMCGDWSRVTSPTVTTHNGTTGVFLDPPYSSDCQQDCYAVNEVVSDKVREWAIERGDDMEMRIALCGYEGEHEMPETWECFAWKARGGYGNRSDKRGRENAHRERIWFSPHCLRKMKKKEA